MGFAPTACGACLLTLVGDLSVAEYARRAGISELTLARSNNGEVDRPGFLAIMRIGMLRGLSPTDLAAVAKIDPVEEPEAETLARLAERLLEHLHTPRGLAPGVDERELSAMRAGPLADSWPRTGPGAPDGGLPVGPAGRGPNEAVLID